jgi:hypothetical protein
MFATTTTTSAQQAYWRCLLMKLKGASGFSMKLAAGEIPLGIDLAGSGVIGNVRYWHLADILTKPLNVRFRG